MDRGQLKHQYQAEQEKWAQMIILAEDPVLCSGLRVREFLSRTKGRGRLRPYPKQVRLIGYEGHWRLWPEEEDDTAEGRLPWDQWATELFQGQACLLNCQVQDPPGDHLREHLLKLLELTDGYW